jgi:transcriptional regulator with XRE-family HTH domain
MRGAGPLDEAVASAMRRERDRRKWRQVDLAGLLHWPLSRVTRIEAGEQRVLVGDLVPLCRALGMSTADLLSEASPADLQTLGLVPGAMTADRADRVEGDADPATA